MSTQRGLDTGNKTKIGTLYVHVAIRTRVNNTTWITHLIKVCM